MKNTWVGIAALAAIVVALGITGWAYAQSPSGSPFTGGMMGEGWGGHAAGGMYGQGMMGMGSGHMDEDWGGMMGAHQDMEALHDYMFPAMASALGLTADELEERHAAGETFWDLAEAQGLTQEAAWALMQAARTQALQQAVEDGAIDQATADWMQEHSAQMHADGAWAGGGHCDEEGAQMRMGVDY